MFIIFSTHAMYLSTIESTPYASLACDLIFAASFSAVSTDFAKARYIKADHFERTLGRCAARVNQNQQARTNRHISLDLDTILLWSQQMAATRQLFEHPEK